MRAKLLAAASGPIIANTLASSKAELVRARVKEAYSSSDLLFRLVVSNLSDDEVYLGVVEDVELVADSAMSSVTYKIVSINNFLSRKKNAVGSVTNVPGSNADVRLASTEDLRSFFPSEPFPRRGYLGFVQGTEYQLPLNLERLVDVNTVIVAGSGHGKSFLAARLALELHLIGTRVLIVDPTGEWSGALEKLTLGLSEEIRNRIHWVSHLLPFVPAASKEARTTIQSMFDSFESGKLTVLDVSFNETEGNSEAKLQLRCNYLYDIQEEIMRMAVKDYSGTKKLQAEGCLFLDEAHEFVPAKPIFEIQSKLLNLYAIATKEYRKYGLGQVFVDQSLASISDNLEIQTFFLGLILNPLDKESLSRKLGHKVASSVGRIVGGIQPPTWIAYGAATPRTGIPWEIHSFGDDAFERVFASEHGRKAI